MFFMIYKIKNKLLSFLHADKKVYDSRLDSNVSHDVPPSVFFGKSSTGETISVKNILYSIMSVTDPKHLRITYIGKKDKEFDFLKDSPFNYVLPVDTSNNIEAIKYLEDESKRRITLFKKYKVSNLTEYNKLLEEDGKPTLPEIIAVTDSFSDIALKDSIKYFARTSHLTEIRILLAYQPARKSLIFPPMTLSDMAEKDLILPETDNIDELMKNPGKLYSIRDKKRDN